MEEMIKRIIDMDKKAREITESAAREKLESEKEIAENAEKLKNEYLAKARLRIAKSKKSEAEAMNRKWEQAKIKYDSQISRLNALYAQNGDKWAEAIAARVLEPM